MEMLLVTTKAPGLWLSGGVSFSRVLGAHSPGGGGLTAQRTRIYEFPSQLYLWSSFNGVVCSIKYIQYVLTAGYEIA